MNKIIIEITNTLEQIQKVNDLLAYHHSFPVCGGVGEIRGGVSVELEMDFVYFCKNE